MVTILFKSDVPVEEMGVFVQQVRRILGLLPEHLGKFTAVLKRNCHDASNPYWCEIAFNGEVFAMLLPEFERWTGVRPDRESISKDWIRFGSQKALSLSMASNTDSMPERIIHRLRGHLMEIAEKKSVRARKAAELLPEVKKAATFKLARQEA